MFHRYTFPRHTVTVNSAPILFLRQRKSAWQIRWTYAGEEYAMSIGAATNKEAKIICATAAIALAAKDDWPPDLVAMPAVKRYTSDSTPRASATRR